MAILRFVQKDTVQIEENPDLDLPITPAVKQILRDRRDSLKAEIKTITGAW